jgi:hypothetical protein
VTDASVSTYEEALDLLTESMCNFGDDGIADDLAIAVQFRFPEVDPDEELDEDYNAEDTRRITVILDALRLATTQYEAELARLQEEQA